MKLSFIALSLLVGCGGMVGDGQDGATPDASGSTIDGIWNGYIEGYAFPSQSNKVVLVLQAKNGVVTGTTTFGSGTLPAPNPDVGYPPSSGNSSFPGEGFGFTIVGGSFDGSSHVKVGVQTSELYKAWCALQTKTYPWGMGLFHCVPNGTSGTLPDGGDGGVCFVTDPMTMKDILYDCYKMRLCQGDLCVCTQAACAVAQASGSDIAFDLILKSSTMDGTVGGGIGSHNVHFQKQ